MARSACGCGSSITNDDSKYHWELLDRFVGFPQNGARPQGHRNPPPSFGSSEGIATPPGDPFTHVWAPFGPARRCAPAARVWWGSRLLQRCRRAGRAAHARDRQRGQGPVLDAVTSHAESRVLLHSLGGGARRDDRRAGLPLPVLARRPDPDRADAGARLDPFVALSFIAAATRDVRRHRGVAPGRDRPVVVAKQAASLDVLSGGRLALGVGVGWSAEEFAALGDPLPRACQAHGGGRRHDARPVA